LVGHDNPAGAPAVHTLSEAALILRVKESWLERQAAARKIPFAMLGGSYRFTSEHLTAIVRIHEKVPVPELEAQPEQRPRTPRRSNIHTLTPLRPRPRATAARRAA
jgi:excisionase family DNA binding protein